MPAFEREFDVFVNIFVLLAGMSSYLGMQLLEAAREFAAAHGYEEEVVAFQRRVFFAASAVKDIFEPVPWYAVIVGNRLGVARGREELREGIQHCPPCERQYLCFRTFTQAHDAMNDAYNNGDARRVVYNGEFVTSTRLEHGEPLPVYPGAPSASPPSGQNSPEVEGPYIHPPSEVDADRSSTHGDYTRPPSSMSYNRDTWHAPSP